MSSNIDNAILHQFVHLEEGLEPYCGLCRKILDSGEEIHYSSEE